MRDDDLTPLWKALADPTRRQILDLLRQAPRTTGELSETFAGVMSRYAVMKHLTVLAEAELILVRRQGRERYNHLNVVPLQRLYERWLRPYEAEWARSLINLKQSVEGVPMPVPSDEQTIRFYQIEQEIRINAPVAQAYAALLDFNGWWAQRQSRHPDSLRFEAVVGGRLWETRDGSAGNGIIWGMVTSIEPNDHIMINGNIGMPGAVMGSVTLCTNPQDDGTTQVTLSHQFMGTVPPAFRDGFAQGWADNLQNLQKLIETGERVKP